MEIKTLFSPDRTTARARFLPILVAITAVATAQPTPSAPQNPMQHGLPVPAGAVGVVNGRTVSWQAFADAVAQEQSRPNADPRVRAALDALIDEHLVRREMTRRGLQVSDADVDRAIGDLARQLDRDLDEILREQGVPREVFQRKYRQVVALDLLVRSDGIVPQGLPVENSHRAAWLADRKEHARILRHPDPLPAGAIAVVEGEIVPTDLFCREAMLLLEPKELGQTAEALLKEQVALEILGRKNLSLDDSDLLAEWRYRKSRFEKDPRYAGYPYEEIVKQQTGLTPGTARDSLGFRVNAMMGVIARDMVTEQDLAAGYRQHENRYGPRLTVRHILLEATDNELRQKTGVPSFSTAFDEAQQVMRDLDRGIPFGDLVQTWSDDKGTKLKGGLLPTFTPGRTVYEQALVNAALELPVGATSKPVQTRSGWHVLRVEAKEPALPLTEPEVEEDLRRFLAQEMFDHAWRVAPKGVHIRVP